jgi:3-methyladenine DNA glycosylase AlkC
MVQHLLGRKGAARIALIPAEVLEALNDGQVPTVNLNEFLALDLGRLTRNVARHIGLSPDADGITDTLAMLAAFRPVKRHEHVARALYDLARGHPDRDAIAHRLATHASDVARGWATQWVQFSELPLPAKLQSVRRFAADPHFGVREMAWMAVRDRVGPQLDEALALLDAWVHDADENIRRFASELTRPRGVWCAPIEVLKAQPWRALPLLEPLKSDSSRYVRTSVANWLNDASKSQPQWVDEVCRRWVREAPGPECEQIVRRACRTVRA